MVEKSMAMRKRALEIAARPAASSDPVRTGSRRQQEVLDLLYRGFTYREIAKILVISEDAIRTYIKRLYRRLEVTSCA